MCPLCKNISCAEEQNVTLLNSGASIAIMVNEPSSLVEMAHPLGRSADYFLIQDVFLADISTTEQHQDIKQGEVYYTVKLEDKQVYR